MKIQKNTVEDSEGLTLLDRDKCFKVVAGAVKAVAKNAIVDLKSPEVTSIHFYVSTLFEAWQDTNY